MLNRLSPKDIKFLSILAKTPEDKSALDEYIEQHEKAVKAYKIYRESVVVGVEVEKVVKPVETKRKFKAGDKVRVLSTENALATSGLRIGDVTEVLKYSLGYSVVVLKSPHQTGYAYFDESALELVEEKTPNELRAEVIQRAKEFVENDSGIHVIKRGRHYTGTSVEFVVNENKRAVVALMRNDSRKLVAKGIAKCIPDDVFNADIGKAIALGRALGKDVSEFENAVQPNEVVVSHVVKGNEASGVYSQEHKFTLTSKQGCDTFYYAESEEYSNQPNDFIYNWQIGGIINDTNAQYEESVEYES